MSHVWLQGVTDGTQECSQHLTGQHSQASWTLHSMLAAMLSRHQIIPKQHASPQQAHMMMPRAKMSTALVHGSPAVEAIVSAKSSLQIIACRTRWPVVCRAAPATTSGALHAQGGVSTPWLTGSKAFRCAHPCPACACRVRAQQASTGSLRMPLLLLTRCPAARPHSGASDCSPSPAPQKRHLIALPYYVWLHSTY